MRVEDVIEEMVNAEGGEDAPKVENGREKGSHTCEGSRSWASEYDEDMETAERAFDANADVDDVV